MNGIQDTGAQSGRRIQRHRCSQLGRGFGIAGNLRPAQWAAGQMGLEGRPFGGLQGVHGVQGGQVVEIAGSETGLWNVVAHCCAPSAAPSLFKPSLILALAVPKGMSSRWATSWYVHPL